MAGLEDRIESRSRSFVPEEGWAKVSVPSGGPRLEKFNQRRVKFVRQRLSNESDDLLHTRDVRNERVSTEFLARISNPSCVEWHLVSNPVLLRVFLQSSPDNREHA